MKSEDRVRVTSRTTFLKRLETGLCPFEGHQSIDKSMRTSTDEVEIPDKHRISNSAGWANSNWDIRQIANIVDSTSKECINVGKKKIDEQLFMNGSKLTIANLNGVTVSKEEADGTNYCMREVNRTSRCRKNVNREMYTFESIKTCEFALLENTHKYMLSVRYSNRR
jgi:hypothetical protein